MRTVLLLISITLLNCCSITNNINYLNDNIKVLLLSDHTLPEHLNLASAGANGEERTYIDPTLTRLQQLLAEIDLDSMILNVEDVAADGHISSKTEFDSAYATYDDILREAVAQKLTIIAVHYDANILRDEDDPTKVTYTGGAQIILDERAVSNSTLALANRLIRDDKLLQQLNDTGLRIRPDYDDEIRYQSNLTLNIIGHSDGAGLLLEIGPQEQAIELFGTPEAIVSAIEKPLQTLASAIKSHRKTMR